MKIKIIGNQRKGYSVRFGSTVYAKGKTWTEAVEIARKLQVNVKQLRRG